MKKLKAQQVFSNIIKIIVNQPFKGVRPKVILVLGGPQSGKNTQSKYIESTYGFVYLSVSEIVKDEVAKYKIKKIYSFFLIEVLKVEL